MKCETIERYSILEPKKASGRNVRLYRLHHVPYLPGQIKFFNETSRARKIVKRYSERTHRQGRVSVSKKRKACTLSQPRGSQSLSRVRPKSPLPIKRPGSRVKPCLKNSLKKETFKSLESLFQLDKPFLLELEEFQQVYPPAEEQTELKQESSVESLSRFLHPEHFIEKLRSEFQEPDNPYKIEVDEHLTEESKSTPEELKKTKVASPVSPEIEEDSLSNKMADEEEVPVEENVPVEEVAEAQQDGEEDNRTIRTIGTEKSGILKNASVKDTKSINNSVKDAKSTKSIYSSIKDAKSAKSFHCSEEESFRSIDCSEKEVKSNKSMNNCSEKDAKSNRSICAPEYPLPPCIGEGYRIGCGKSRDSLMSEIPITECEVIEEMLRLEAIANCIRMKISDLKRTIQDLTCKDELTEEDTCVLKNTQAEVMQKVGELNEITRKFQRMIGLMDPSSQTFAAMFDMLPYPHTRMEKRRSCGKLSLVKGCEKFAFPEVDYPEDKLPRVIICGNTEENFPKIVVADSRPKSRGNACLENLQGKLSESLCLQEKLAKENAQLEGGRFELERELLEKDNAVECLQRKVCGLQAEMRIIVKENTELSRQFACFAQQQKPLSCCSLSPVNSPCQSPPVDACRSRPNSGCSPTKPPFCCPPPPPPRPKSCCGGRPSAPPKSPCCSPERPSTGCGRSTPPKSPCCSPQRPSTGCDRSTPPKSPCSPPPRPTSGCGNRSRNSCREAAARPCDSPRLAGGASRGGEEGFTRSPGETTMQRMGGGGGGGGCGKQPGQAQRGACPAEIEERLAAYGNNTKFLGEQLCNIETEVRNLQTELLNVQRERQQLEQQRKMLEGAGSSCACCPEPPKPKKLDLLNYSGPCDDSPEVNACAAQQLRDLREQYARLQDDYKSKLCEVSRLRADAESRRREAREAKEERECMEIKLIDAQERTRAIEAERNELLGTKEQLVEQEQALLVARQRFRESQDELEELRTMIRDQAAQLDDYRNKYLQAQQQVEEQRRQLDLMEMDNARMNENVTLEIGRVKNQFQEKLAELAPLPDILKQTQIKLQETQQLRMMAENNCEDLSRELLACKDKIDAMQTQINDLQREIQALQDDKNDGSSKIEELERKNSELRNENERLKNTIARIEEQQVALQKRLDEKQHEVVQLTAMLEQVREDSARQVSRTKERCEAIKRSMQAQISDFEIQLAQCRAAAKTAQKERDEIRQKMQGQIGNLNEALQQAQGRIRSLQGHVDYLKVSYSNVFGTQGQGESPPQQTDMSAQGQGYDSCDCNY